MFKKGGMYNQSYPSSNLQSGHEGQSKHVMPDTITTGGDYSGKIKNAHHQRRKRWFAELLPLKTHDAQLLDAVAVAKWAFDRICNKLASLRQTAL